MPESKKRILIFSTAYFPFIGGAEVAIQEITKRIPDRAWELITARLDARLPKEEMIENVLVHRIGFGMKLDKLLLPVLGTLKVFSILHKRPIDAFWGVMATFASGVAYIVNILRFWKRIPVILTLQEGDSEKHIDYGWGGLIGLSWRLALARTDTVTAISTYLKDRAHHYGYKGDVAVVPNGVSIETFDVTLSEEKKQELRKRFKINETDTVLLNASRLVLKNGVDDTIRALSHLDTNTKLLIFGSGEDRKALETLAQELGVSKRVIFFGKYTHIQLAHYLQISDVFIRPSLSEGMGNVFLEAMAAGVPVVATPVGGIPDFLFDGDTGLFCKVRNSESIATQVKRIISDSTLREHLIKNAKQLVKEKYDWDSIAHRMQEQLTFTKT